MVAGTGKSDDSGTDSESSFGGVAPLSSLIANYNSISGDVCKVCARAVGAEHEQMLMRFDGYMTVWMFYFLQGNEEAKWSSSARIHRYSITSTGRILKRTGNSTMDYTAVKKHRALKIIGIIFAVILVLVVALFIFLKTIFLKSFTELKGEP